MIVALCRRSWLTCTAAITTAPLITNCGSALSRSSPWIQRTLELGFDIVLHSATKYLNGHSDIPGLPSHPQHQLAARQMHGFGGMITIHLDSDLAGTRRFLEHTRLFALAESLGGVESLIEHPALMTHGSIPPEQRAALGVDDALVRLSVGVEDLDDQREDLSLALDYS